MHLVCRAEEEEGGEGMDEEGGEEVEDEDEEDEIEDSDSGNTVLEQPSKRRKTVKSKDAKE